MHQQVAKKDEEGGGQEKHWAGTRAEAYAKHRGNIPSEVIEYVIDTMKLSEESRLLDVACGTGLCAVGFAPFVQSVTGIDISEDMTREACALSEARGLADRTTFIEGDVTLDGVLSPGPYDTATICRAFFALNKQEVLAHLDPIIVDDGGVVVIDEPNFYENYEPWQKTLRQKLQEWIPGIREPHTETISTADALRQSAFSDVTVTTITIPRTWSTESLLAVMESTTLSPKPVLGERYPDFVNDLTQAFEKDYPNGVLPERARYRIHVGKRSQDVSKSE